MKITFEFNLTRREKRIAAFFVLPIVLGVAAVAYAGSLPKTWADMDTLNATDLNADFAYLDGRTTNLESHQITTTAWATYTPVLTNGGTPITTSPYNGSTATGYWRRVGDSVEVSIDTQIPTCSGMSILRWSLPTGLLVDPGKAPTYATLGTAFAASQSNAVTRPTVIGPGGSDDPNTVTLFIGATDGQAFTCADLGGNNGFVRMEFTAPIQGWDIAN